MMMISSLCLVCNSSHLAFDPTRAVPAVPVFSVTPKKCPGARSRASR